MDKRLIKLLQSNVYVCDIVMLDTYNQKAQTEIACTIKTNIDTSNLYFIMEKIEIVGHTHKGQSGVVYGTNGISPTITINKGDGQRIAEPAVKNPLKGKIDKSWQFIQQVYDRDGIIRTIKASNGSGNIPKVIEEPVVLGWTRDKKGNVIDRHPVEVANCVTSAKRDNTQNYVVVPANTKTGEQLCEIGGVIDISYPSSSSRRGRVQENGTIAPTLTCGCENTHARIEPHNLQDYYRIRKLTERECFRLQGVSDEYSDKIRSVVSKSQCYKLAGNSIVVDVLVKIFKNLFIHEIPKFKQLELF